MKNSFSDGDGNENTEINSAALTVFLDLISIYHYLFLGLVII